MIGRMLADAGPGHLKVPAMSPYEKVILRANHFPIRSIRTNVEITAPLSTGIFWHRHFVPFPIYLSGYCVVITQLKASGLTLTVKMALFTANASTGKPDALLPDSEVEWADDDFDLAGGADNQNWSGRRKMLGGPKLISLPGASG